ncbi:imidazole glycerol phosphate synthase subunit HisF [Pseudomonadota bacterium]
MLTKRIIPCLDVKDGVVIKGVKFRNHEVVGNIIELARRYCDEGADELVLYDITASTEERVVGKEWIKKIAEQINIPFCVAGGIRNMEQAEQVLKYGADKFSINSPALENPNLITEFAKVFGSQAVIVGIDSRCENGDYFVYQYTGDEKRTVKTKKRTLEWVREVEDKGAGEIVLNCINKDGVRTGYDIEQLKKVRDVLNIPLIASGGAGEMKHFKNVFLKANVDGALAASVFHKSMINIGDLKSYLKSEKIMVRI